LRTFVPVFTRIFSALLALALIAAGVVVLVEVVAAWLGIGWTILPTDTAARFEEWHWDDRAIVVTSVIVLAVGVVALLIGLWRRAPLTIPIDDSADVTFERHALEQSLRRRVEALDGVTSARIHAGTKRLRARVDTNRRHRPEEVKARVEDHLAHAAAAQHLDLTRNVQLRYRGGRM
jgi:hypothetical protein